MMQENTCSQFAPRHDAATPATAVASPVTRRQLLLAGMLVPATAAAAMLTARPAVATTAALMAQNSISPHQPMETFEALRLFLQATANKRSRAR